MLGLARNRQTDGWTDGSQRWCCLI